MTEKREQQPSSDVTVSWLGRRTFVGSLVALFGALNVWVFGKKAGWWSKQSSQLCEVIVKGPFPENERISLEPPSCDFVEPYSIKVKKRDDGVVKATLEFEFKGPEESKREIDVRVDFHDHLGNVLASKQLVCSDARLRAKNPVALGTAMFQFSRVNHEVLKLQLEIDQVDSIALARIRFLEI